jgi:NO-binding membrane sensor protein with MHYT domain
MSAVNHFTHGPLTPALAYVMSCMGSMLGLRLTAQAHASSGGSRIRWLIGAAISIGGTGVWVMHFIGMMGFDVDGTQIRYDVPLTVASAVVAIVVVGAGLFLVSYGNGRVVFLLGGGLLTGLGVASMHYLGMYAMNMSASVSYDRLTVAASVVIAIVAATAALWFTLRVRRPIWITAAALVMGVAVSGMHYTGMYALRVVVDPEPGVVTGADALDFLVPLMTVISLITLTMLLMVILSPSEKELNEDAELVARLELRRRGARQQPAFAPPGPASAPPGPAVAPAGPAFAPSAAADRPFAPEPSSDARPPFGMPPFGSPPAQQQPGPHPQRRPAPYQEQPVFGAPVPEPPMFGAPQHQPPQQGQRQPQEPPLPQRRDRTRGR